LAGSFSKQGKSVLLIDADPQGSLSQGCFGSSAIEQLAAEQTLAAVFQSGAWPEVSGLITPTEIDNVAIIRANHTLADFNHCQPENSGMVQFALSELLATAPSFDVVLLDCPPNLYLCSWAAMLAADFALIPVPPEDFGTQGLRAVHQ
jgi:chromosome partitioning protein